MNTPKYNFYVGKLLRDFPLRANYGIDPQTGEYISVDGLYSSNIIELNKNEALFFDILLETTTLVASTNKLYFYDANKQLIPTQTYSLSSRRNNITIPADKAKYWAVQFSTLSNTFNAYRGTDFIYTLQPIVPHYKELNKKYSQERGQQFFRESIDGDISLFGNDYKLINGMSLEDKLKFIITKPYSSTTQTVYSKADFTKIDCTLNHAAMSCKLKLSSSDKYTAILGGLKDNYDLIKLAPAITSIDLNKRPLIQIYISGGSTISNFIGGTYWESEVAESISRNPANDLLVEKYYFNFIKTIDEVYINSSNTAVNGVYCGGQGSWTSANGEYQLYIEEVSHAGGSVNCYLRLKGLTTNTLLYSSVYYLIRVDADGNRYITYNELTQKDVSLYDIRPGEYAAPITMISATDKSDTFNINTIGAPNEESSVIAQYVYMRWLCDLGEITSGSSTIKTYDIPNDDFAYDNTGDYHKCIGLDAGQIYATARSTSEPTKFGQNDYGQYFTDRFIPPSAGVGRVLPVCRNHWANVSIWYAFTELYYLMESAGTKEYTLKNSYSIGAVIQVLLKKIDPTIRHYETAEYSQFLYGTTPLISSANRPYVYITPKSNIIKGEYDQAAQKGEISLEDITNLLRDCFRCYWFLDGNKFRIEHISYFMNGGTYTGPQNIQLDLTVHKDQFNKKPVLYFQSAVEYDMPDLIKRYEFGWMDNATELFSGISVDVKNNYIPADKKEEVIPSKFSADLDYLMLNPGDVSNDGFALLCPIRTGLSGSYFYKIPIIQTTLLDDYRESYTARVQNFYASWNYLLNFYMYDMPGDNIEGNTLPTISTAVVDIKKSMLQDIGVMYGEDLTALGLIRTDIGEGSIGEIVTNIDTHLTKISLRFRPE